MRSKFQMPVGDFAMMRTKGERSVRYADPVPAVKAQRVASLGDLEAESDRYTEAEQQMIRRLMQTAAIARRNGSA